MTPVHIRILRRVEVDANGCWVWGGKTNNGGYGQIGSGGRGGRDLLTHRAMYEHVCGSIPAGLDLDHKCRNRRCCNPVHLEPLTRLDNLLRGVHPNMITKRTGVCKRGHHVSGENAITGRDGRVRCRTCTNARKRVAWSAKKPRQQPAEDKGDFVWRGVTR